MAISDTYNKEGIKVRAEFNLIVNEEMGENEFEPKFIHDFPNYLWIVDDIDIENLTGDIWFWVTESSDISAIKAHSSIITVLKE